MYPGKLSVGFILLPNFTLTPFANIIDMLRLAADEGDRSRQVNCKWTILGDANRPIRSSCGAEMRPWEDFGDPRRFHYVVVVGGLLRRSREWDEAILHYLREADKAGATIVGVCTGVMMLAQAGLLEGRHCCVSWYHLRDLQDEFPHIKPDATHLFRVDGRTITCAGGVGAIDLAAWMVERHLGRATAQKALRVLMVDKAKPETAAQPQPPIAANIPDERVRRAVLLMEQRLGEPLSIEALAREIGLSKRQLERLFQQFLGCGPLVFHRRLRLDQAQWLLETTTRSITEIAGETGFADGAHLSRQFRQTFGMTPSAARESFS